MASNTYPYPSELIQIMKARSGPAPVCLLDVVRLDGCSFHWGSVEIDVTPRLPETLPGTAPAWAATLANPPADYDTHYFPWLLSATGFHHTRSMQSDTANIVVQNVSGNTLQRDLPQNLSAASFEGAIFAFREYDLSTGVAEFEQWGRLTVMTVSETQTTFGANQLYNPNDYDGLPYSYSETCQWRYSSPGCGDTTNNPCDNTYVTCRQPNRFLGVLNNVVFPEGGVANISTNQVEYRRLV